ncbi:MAG: hypothetical protein PHE45_04430, partial [Bacteroidales bacterium]|nr:hypothetical protein [Bacteroidales bacterium]
MKKIYSLLLVMVILFAGCGKENVPEVITGDVFNVTATTASITGNVLDDNNSDITEAGYCWGTNENITYENNLGIVKDAFVGNGNMIDYTITDLLPAETYFVRAFAVNGVGIGYGNVKQFVVSKTVPEVSLTIDAIDVRLTTITITGVVEAENGAEILKRGFLYSTSSNPQEGSDKVYATEYDETTGAFTATITGLTTGTKYYFKAFATNLMGAGYSEVIGEATTDTAIKAFAETIIDANGVKISACVVTVGLWKEVMENVLSSDEGYYPQVSISYTSMQTFIEKLNAKGIGTYALPTVEEWRTAAGSYTYSGSEDIDAVAWYAGNSGGT